MLRMLGVGLGFRVSVYGLGVGVRVWVVGVEGSGCRVSWVVRAVQGGAGMATIRVNLDPFFP